MMKTGNEQQHTVVQKVDSLLHDAITRHASDIHLEPTKNNLRVRFRIDGVLFDEQSITNEIAQQVISRLKVLAGMNIAQKRIPQDGKMSIQINEQPIDLRVSTFPSLFGETMVVRILDRGAQMIELEQLGFSQLMLDEFKQLIGRANGFFLVTGPTGSGKTTTLYAALAMLNTPEKNIVTLEDPVEYNLEGITQGHINPQAGFTFEQGIRSLLRQDPDVLMVGEIRDKQTARVAIEAALTGHLVLSTLHTNDAPSAIMRLMDMSVEPFLINAAITGVLAQRLVRKLCDQCKQETVPTNEEKKVLEKLGIILEKMYKPNGCYACNQVGYHGRTGIFELLTISPALHELISEDPKFDAINEQAMKDGMHTLMQDAMQKLKHGTISLEELLRVIH